MLTLLAKTNRGNIRNEKDKLKLLMCTPTKMKIDGLCKRRQNILIISGTTRGEKKTIFYIWDDIPSKIELFFSHPNKMSSTSINIMLSPPSKF